MTVVDLANLGSRGFVLKADGDSGHAGTSVSSAGDVNGDGFEDFIVGAPGAGDRFTRGDGAAYVIFGTKGGFSSIDLSSLAPPAGFIIRGARYDFAAAGTSVSSAGDINGDGFDDLLIGAPASNNGDAYVVFGKASGADAVDLSTFLPNHPEHDPTAGFIIRGHDLFDRAGASVSGAGDVNGDGFDDFIIGAPAADGGGDASGEAYVVFGKPSGFEALNLADLDPSSASHDPALGFMLIGDGQFDVAGASVSSAGDVNGDGLDDIVIGSPSDNNSSLHAGDAYVLFGKSGGFGKVDLGALSPAQGFVIKGGDSFEDAGRSVAGAGDVNGDGFDDIIIGVPNGDAGDFARGGEAYVIFGKAGGFSRVDLQTFEPGHPKHDPSLGFLMRAHYGNAGWSVSSAGDVNGDGFDDIIVGARYGGAEFRSGAAYVVFGKARGFGFLDLDGLTSIDGFLITGAGKSDNAGSSVSSAGDINGDGFDDIIVGAPGNGGESVGAVYVIYGSTGAVVRVGNSGNNNLRGGAFDDKLYGRAGDDILSGDAGNDLLAGESGSDRLYGGPGNDVMDGGAGTDTMTGGAGDDVYVVDNAGDKVIETSAAGGVDRVKSSVTYTLGAYVENLVLTGTAALSGTGNGRSNAITGNAAANTLTGWGGDDLLDGRGGADTMNGGNGNDLYVVNEAGDKVVESSASGGVDTVNSAISYTLGANLENLVLLGTAAKATGNALNNKLTGNAAANILDGKSGADTMAGGAGADLYFVDNAGDKAIELAGGGTDTVSSAISYALPDFVEKLILTGTAVKGTGNGLANHITGNAAANVLDGGAGTDTLAGGGGNDTYLANASDAVVELADGGVDTVQSTSNFVLPANVEKLVLTGIAALGTGNGLANRLTGNASDNVLDGKSGADAMAGGKGNDTYIVDNAGDTVTELAGEGVDTVKSSVSFSLGGQSAENLTLTGTAAIDGTGNGLANALTGNAAANTFKGWGGDDTIGGGGGNDRLYGMAGRDTLSGGGGRDGFFFDTALGAGNEDRILDFAPVDDAIHLARTIFTKVGPAGTLAAGAFHKGSAAADAGDRIVYDQDSGKIYYDLDGTGGGAQVLFATVNPGTALTNADFWIYG